MTLSLYWRMQALDEICLQEVSSAVPFFILVGCRLGSECSIEGEQKALLENIVWSLGYRELQECFAVAFNPKTKLNHSNQSLETNLPTGLIFSDFEPAFVSQLSCETMRLPSLETLLKSGQAKSLVWEQLKTIGTC